MLGREVGAELAPSVLRARVVRVGGLEEAQTQTHHGAALDLALDERRVDGAAHVVALDEARDANLAGLVVDLDLGDARRVGDRGVGIELDGAGLGVDRGVGLESCARAGDELAEAPGRFGATSATETFLSGAPRTDTSPSAISRSAASASSSREAMSRTRSRTRSAA